MKYKRHIFQSLILIFLLSFNNNYLIAQEKEPVKETKIQVQEFQAQEVPFNRNALEFDISERGSETTLAKVNTNNHGRNGSSTGDGTDVTTPANSPFSVGNDISGVIQKSVNEGTGKIAFSVPLASIFSGPVSYPLNLNYDGQSGFKIGKEGNKYSPTTAVGVGWSITIPKIMVDNKQTSVREDDEFYFIDGGTSSKLICFNKEPTFWEFQLEKFVNWKITHSLVGDTWAITKEDGKTYIFGEYLDINYSKERISVWGNWIGDSNKTPSSSTTTAWNLQSVRDQWNNFITFKYEQVLGRQNTSQTINKHTEAIYLKEIVSSRGAKIKLNYGFKDSYEYFEPHQEKNEPDAYQERYEKKYVQSAEIYNNDNTLVTSYDLGYSLQTSSNANKKRYLTSITQRSHANGLTNALPPQEFQYHYTGTYKGGLKKVIYPSGGSADYNYQNEYLYFNGGNRFENAPNWPSGYVFYAALVRDNYQLYVRRSTNPVSGNKYQFKIFRYWWNGEQWESHEFTFPHLMEDSNTEHMKNFYPVFEDNFYGFAFDKGSTADVYLFHKEKNGNTWNYYTQSNLNIADKDPRFMSGDSFVGLGSQRDGRLYTYAWNGTGWNSKQINQGSGKYYYAARNNFILSLDVRIKTLFNQFLTSTDMVTGMSHQDNYYIHYLDAEKKWQTKSWSAYANSQTTGITDPSYFYPANSLTGFVADNNPEFFLRWDTNYNLFAVDNVLGSYNDSNPIVPVANSLFTIRNWFYGTPYKSARFNGVNWNVGSLPSSSTYYAKLNFGEDIMTFQDHNSISGVGYHLYDPNANGFSYSSLNGSGLIPNSKGNGINREFTIAGNKIYRKSIQGIPTILFQQIGGLQYSNDFTYTDGLSHAFVKESLYSGNSIVFKKGSYFYIDKENGLLSKINVNQYHLAGSSKFGGYTPFMSPSSMWLRTETTCDNNNNCTFTPYVYRIIDDKFNASVYNIVMNRIDLNDDNGAIRKIEYTYNNPNTVSDNSITYYGEVVIEHKGFGSNSIGKTKKIFNTGANDVQLVGLPLEEHILDANNNLKSKVTTTWAKKFKLAHNGSFQVDQSHYIVLNSKKEEDFIDSDVLTKTTTYTHNSYGQLSSATTTNSKGLVEKRNIRYGHEQYSFMRDANMLSDSYETTTRLNNEIVDLNRNIWFKQPNSPYKIYLKENLSGPDASRLRLNSEVTQVDNRGNLLEVTNGKNIYNAALNGYQDLYEVATITNARYQDVINELDVTYNQLKLLNTVDLKEELTKLYDRLPNAMINLTFYDDNGRVTHTINERKQATYLYYDSFGRLDYITDDQGNIIEKKEYNFGH